MGVGRGKEATQDLNIADIPSLKRVLEIGSLPHLLDSRLKSCDGKTVAKRPVHAFRLHVEYMRAHPEWAGILRAEGVPTEQELSSQLRAWLCSQFHVTTVAALDSHPFVHRRVALLEILNNCILCFPFLRVISKWVIFTFSVVIAGILRACVCSL